MKGSIYDYQRQCWTHIDTDTDTPEGPHQYRTVDGVPYEVNPEDSTQYRNRTRNTDTL